VYVSNDLGRFVPVSTGGGKALFIGTYLPGNGIHEGVKQHLLHQTRGGPPIPAERLPHLRELAPLPPPHNGANGSRQPLDLPGVPSQVPGGGRTP